VIGLLAWTAAWASTFFLLKDVVERVPVSVFFARGSRWRLWRCVLIAPRCVRRSARRAASPACCSTRVRRSPAAADGGTADDLGLGVGFVTGMYVVSRHCSPLLRGRASATPVWFRSAVDGGLAVLSLQGSRSDGGEALTLASAAAYAAHIVGLGVWSSSARARPDGRAAADHHGRLRRGCRPGASCRRPRGLVRARLHGAGRWALALVVQTWAQAHLSRTRARSS
jgi:hypothetical protein